MHVAPSTRSPAPRSGVAGRLALFLILTFVIGWGVLVVLALFTAQIEAVFGPLSGTNPVFILAVYSPAITAVILIWHDGGFSAVRRYLGRLRLWRMSTAWWLGLLLGVPALKYLSALFNGTAADFPFSPWYTLLPALVLALFIGPVEEIGWRGYALPLLQRRVTPLVASLILGTLWGLWHLPAFLLSGTPQSAWVFGPFLIGAVALSLFMDRMYNVTGGSILLPALFHFQANVPAWPEGQPWENYVFAAAALVLVLWKRDEFLRRDFGVTDIVPRPLPAATAGGHSRG